MSKFLKALGVGLIFGAALLLIGIILKGSADGVSDELMTNPAIAVLGIIVCSFIFNLQDGSKMTLKGFIPFVIFALIGVAAGIIAAIQLKTESSFVETYYKFATLPMTLVVITIFYIFMGYGKSGLAFEIIIPGVGALATGIAFAIMKDRENVQLIVCIILSIVAVAVMALFTLINKHYPDGYWGQKRSASSYSGGSKKPASSGYSSRPSSSRGSSGSSTPKYTTSYKEEVAASGVSEGQVRSALYGLNASSGGSMPVVSGQVNSVSARTRDRGYNFEINLSIHLRVHKNNIVGDITEGDIRNYAQEVVDKIVSKAESKLDRLDVGYEIDTSITAD